MSKKPQAVKEPLELLCGCQPYPRGERLAKYIEKHGTNIDKWPRTQDPLWVFLYDNAKPANLKYGKSQSAAQVRAWAKPVRTLREELIKNKKTLDRYGDWTRSMANALWYAHEVRVKSGGKCTEKDPCVFCDARRYPQEENKFVGWQEDELFADDNERVGILYEPHGIWNCFWMWDHLNGEYPKNWPALTLGIETDRETMQCIIEQLLCEE